MTQNSVKSSVNGGSAKTMATMTPTAPYPTSFPPQHQKEQPGLESLMNPTPVFDDVRYKGNGKLQGKVAIITGGDSGIGRAVAVAYAKEGADVCIIYFNEHDDADDTALYLKQYGKECLALPVDVSQKNECQQAINKAIAKFGKIDVVVNNAAEQHPQQSVLDITEMQLQRTFATNVFGYFYVVQAALPHLKAGSAIINTASITAYEGNETLIDYSSTKGAIVSFTRSLSASLVKQGIRVNAVAPGPIWTPLIPATFDDQKVSQFGSTTPMGRAGQPCELAPTYVYLASEDSAYVSGQVLHVNGGTVVNG